MVPSFSSARRSRILLNTFWAYTTSCRLKCVEFHGFREYDHEKLSNSSCRARRRLPLHGKATFGMPFL